MKLKWIEQINITKLFQPTRKAALCFLISGKHEIVHEELWKRWISQNQDIINVYIHCTNPSMVTSTWIRQHLLPSTFLMKTDYMHVVPAYFSLMNYAYYKDAQNQWVCFLTDSCVPIIRPCEFRRRFFNYFKCSIFSWKQAWWNVNFVRRANLHLLDKQYHLGHAPWFILSRREVELCLLFKLNYKSSYRMLCNGAVANESLFAIVFKKFGILTHSERIINAVSTVTDWSRMTSATSPYVFRDASEENLAFIRNSVAGNPYAIFLRKVDSVFPQEVLEKMIFTEKEKDKEKGNNAMQKWFQIGIGLGIAVIALTGLFLFML